MKFKNKIWPFLLLTILGILLSLFSYYSIQSAFFPEEELDEYTGIITEKGTFTKTRLLRPDSETKARERVTQSFYYIKLSGMIEPLVTHYLSEDYSELDELLKIGDSVKVTFNTPESENMNFYIYEIRKGETIVFDNSGMRLREKIFGFIAGVAVLLIFLKAYLLLKKN